MSLQSASTIALRPYQQAAIEAVLDYWARGGGNPLVDMATGLGKSVVIGTLTKQLLSDYPSMRVLMLVHVKELVQQNAAALLRLWPQAPIGINSAGLGRRDVHQQVLFASIQSVFRRAGDLGPRDLVLIDEAHLVPNGGDGMYLTLLDKLRERTPDLRVAGFTATPYRMESGRLDDGDTRLFDEVVYGYGVGAGIADGWLSPLISKRSATEIDVSGVARRGGEFVPGALEAAANQDSITRAAVQEMIRYGAERRSWLVFCTGVAHAHAVREALQDAGVTAGTITGETSSYERGALIEAFKAGKVRALTNANVLTTGFDAPATDMIAMLRPTLSTGLYVQMIGRGTRLAESKTNCLVLDFAGVVRRHGPVDTVEIRGKKGGGKGDIAVGEADIRAKECPNCASLMPLAAAVCVDCGYAWPLKEKPKHDAVADDTPILSTEAPAAIVPEEEPVLSWSAKRHSKPGSPDSLKVTYLAGIMSYPEWLCFEHEGFALSRALTWWSQHGGASPAPHTIGEAIDRFGELTCPDAIKVKPDGKWWRVVGRRFASTTSISEAA